MKERFGVRGRALGRSDTMKSVDLTYSESSIVSEKSGCRVDDCSSSSGTGHSSDRSSYGSNGVSK